ncbi:hypothetical protein AAMO2058_000331200 [Amorphochlora amoebiformis]
MTSITPTAQQGPLEPPHQRPAIDPCIINPYSAGKPGNTWKPGISQRNPGESRGTPGLRVHIPSVDSESSCLALRPFLMTDDDTKGIEDYILDQDLFVEIFKYLSGWCPFPVIPLLGYVVSFSISSDWFSRILPRLRMSDPLPQYSHLTLGFEVTRKIRFVSKSWGRRSSDEMLWMQLCQPMWPKLVARGRMRYFGSWRTMYFRRPHVLFDGVYVFEKSYFKTTIVGDSLSLDREIVKCSYFRYVRFLPGGVVLYALMNREPEQALKHIHMNDPRVHHGKYKVRKSVVEVEVDVGYMLLWIKLKILKRDVFSAMRCENLEGLDHQTGEKSIFPREKQPFLFYRMTQML